MLCFSVSLATAVVRSDVQLAAITVAMRWPQGVSTHVNAVLRIAPVR